MPMKPFIQSFDFFPKFSDDVRQKTSSGGVIAVLSLIVMGFLSYERFMAWMTRPPTQRFVVDTQPLPLSSGRKLDPNRLPKMDINFDILMLHMPCSYLHIDVIDVIKEVDESVQGRVRMSRFAPNGDPINEKPHPKEDPPPLPGYCGSCYSVRSGCCNTCKEVRAAFKAAHRPLPPIATIEQCAHEGYIDALKAMVNESCRVHGSLAVHQHPGTFHLAPGDSYSSKQGKEDAYDKLGVDIGSFNMSHRINHFSIGLQQAKGYYPLDGTQQTQAKVGRLKQYYFVRAVPIGIGSRHFSIGVSSYQNYRGNHTAKFPGVYFSYDVSPITVVEVSDLSFVNFLVEISAILGGVFAIATFLDAMLSKCLITEQELPKTE
jgi:hypothetical protein